MNIVKGVSRHDEVEGVVEGRKVLVDSSEC